MVSVYADAVAEYYKLAELGVITIAAFSFVYPLRPSKFLTISLVLLVGVLLLSIYGIYLLRNTKTKREKLAAEDFPQSRLVLYLTYGIAASSFLLGLFFE